MNFLDYATHQQRVIFLFHGYPDTSKVWSEYVDELKKDYHVVTVSFSSEPISVLEFKKKISKKIEEVSSKEIFLIGHDLGAVWASMVADDYKSKVKGIVLIGGLTINQFRNRLKNPSQLIKSWYMFFIQVPKIPNFMINKFDKILLRIPSLLGQENFRPDFEGIKNWWQYKIFLKELIKIDHKIKITSPALILWGNQDAFLNSPTADEFQNEFDQFEIRILSGDHWFHLKETKRVVQIISNFFNGGLYGTQRKNSENTFQESKSSHSL